MYSETANSCPHWTSLCKNCYKFIKESVCEDGDLPIAVGRETALVGYDPKIRRLP